MNILYSFQFLCELKLIFEVYVNKGYISDVVAVVTLPIGLVTTHAASFKHLDSVLYLRPLLRPLHLP